MDPFTAAMAAFDAYHEKDPETEAGGGKEYPKELLYAQRMTDRLNRFAPDAAEVVKLAARCQHIGRWEIPRGKYPMDKKGYLQWRNEEKVHHSRIAEKILSDSGYDTGTITKVKDLLLKKQLATNPDTQLLEDVACLVFVEYYLEPFAARHKEEKVIDILQKTHRKMSASAKDALGQLNLSPAIHSLVARALKFS